MNTENEQILVCVYRDTTNLFTPEEIAEDNLTELYFPGKIVREYYENNAPAFKAKTAYELNLPMSECTFERWLHDVYTADDTDELFAFAVRRGFRASRQ